MKWVFCNKGAHMVPANKIAAHSKNRPSWCLACLSATVKGRHNKMIKASDLFNRSGGKS